MGRAKPITIGGVKFARQSDADAAVKAKLSAAPRDTPFHDVFLAQVVNEHHYEVRAAGQRATGLFKYLTPRGMAVHDPQRVKELRGGNLLMAYFTPAERWEDVTVYPWRRGNPKSNFSRDMREKIALQLPQPSSSDRCVADGCNADWQSLEYDHVTPTFSQMIDEIICLVSQDDIDGRFGYSKFSEGKQTPSRLIPDDHPAFVRLVDLHRDNKWRWVCPLHHRNVGAARLTAARA
jgi:hypothetical protein